MGMAAGLGPVWGMEWYIGNGNFIMWGGDEGTGDMKDEGTGTVLQQVTVEWGRKEHLF